MTAFRRLSVLQLHLSGAAAEPDVDGDAGSSAQLARRACRAAAAAAAEHARPAAGPPVLVGGMVMDLQAHPSGPADVQRGGSVPGRVAQSAGGVARNVAEGLARLLLSDGAPPAALPLLVSAVGDDLAGAALLQHWRGLGLSTQCIAQLPGAATSTVAVVFDRSGEVAACVADVALLEALAPTQLLGDAKLLAATLAACPILMLDGNLPQAALQEACRRAGAAGVPVWFEPVSVPKSQRAAAMLPALTYVSPNEKELAAMAAAARRQRQAGAQHDQACSEGAGCCCRGRCGGCCCDAGQPAAVQTPAASAAAAGAAAAGGAEAQLRVLLPDLGTLLLAGVRHVVLTLGADGAALCSLAPGRGAVEVLHLPALPARVVNCSGAGDCLVAGCLYGLTRGATPAAALAHGVAAARAAVESSSNVPPGLDAAAVRAGAAEAAARGTSLRLALPCSCGAGCAGCR